MPKGRSSHPVWRYVTRSGRKSPRSYLEFCSCNYCGKELLMDASKCKRHLCKSCPLFPPHIKQELLVQMQQYYASQQAVDNNSKQQDNLSVAALVSASDFLETRFEVVDNSDIKRTSRRGRLNPQAVCETNNANQPSVSIQAKTPFTTTVMKPICKEMILTRVESFCAAHRLHSNLLSDETNRAVYGKCNNPNGHGHNYRVEVSVIGSIDPKTGMIMNISDLKQIIDQKVLCVLDHQNLDRDVGYFRDSGIPSTAENIANFIFDQVASSLPIEVTVDSIKLHETDKNIVEIRTRKEQSM